MNKQFHIEWMQRHVYDKGHIRECKKHLLKGYGLFLDERRANCVYRYLCKIDGGWFPAFTAKPKQSNATRRPLEYATSLLFEEPAFKEVNNERR